jgi:hypothetical protein
MIEEQLERIATLLEDIKTQMSQPAVVTNVGLVGPDSSPQVEPTPDTNLPPAENGLPPIPGMGTDEPSQPAAVEVPFNDGPSLVSYVTTTYHALGPEKGQKIQKIMEDLGHTNINEIKPEQYQEFYLAVEAIKGES